MFEDTLDLWKRYLTLAARLWPSDDPRHGLGAEVLGRLEQLDIILDYLRRGSPRSVPIPLKSLD